MIPLYVWALFIAAGGITGIMTGAAAAWIAPRIVRCVMFIVGAALLMIVLACVVFSWLIGVRFDGNNQPL